MNKLIFAMHVSLDGFVAGPEGEMDWIHLPEELFDFVGRLTAKADRALYGRKTFEMMDYYWPTAGDKPNASKHDKEHAAWYNKVTKYVLSNTMKGKDREQVKFISDDLHGKIREIKQQGLGDILIFGSRSAVQALLAENLVDEFYLFVNPVLLGKGIPLFANTGEKTNLQLLSGKEYHPAGVVCLHYAKRQER